jgi:hypothetical protein
MPGQSAIAWRPWLDQKTAKSWWLVDFSLHVPGIINLLLVKFSLTLVPMALCGVYWPAKSLIQDENSMTGSIVLIYWNLGAKFITVPQTLKCQ